MLETSKKSAVFIFFHFQIFNYIIVTLVSDRGAHRGHLRNGAILLFPVYFNIILHYFKVFFQRIT